VRRRRIDIVHAPVRTYYATRSGGSTLDTAAGGGNPFASALIGLARDPKVVLRSLPDLLRETTRMLSHVHQHVDWTGPARRPGWQFYRDGAASPERREALVLVVSDYSRSSLHRSLAGAARDERRIAAMLAESGFSVTQGIGPRRRDLLAALASFSRRASQADVAVIYSTGHGMQLGDEAYLLPGDFPGGPALGRAQFTRHAVGIPRLVRAATARNLNLVFFAGCRTLVPLRG
jgi:hypothetical protein